jgi:hypothetical protein
VVVRRMAAVGEISSANLIIVVVLPPDPMRATTAPDSTRKARLRFKRDSLGF